MKKDRLKKFSIIALFAVSGCSLLPTAKPIDVNTIALQAPMYHPPLPMEIQATEVTFEVLTPEIMEEYLQLVKDGKAPAVAYYALTTQQYEKQHDGTYPRDLFDLFQNVVTKDA